MKVIIDKSMKELGITDIVYACGWGINPDAELTDELKSEIEQADMTLTPCMVM